MRRKFFKVDLHVHTPASSCYSGKNEDDEYLSILENARNNKVDAIAITDHNTTLGYERLMSIKKELDIRYSTLSSLKIESDEINEKISDVKKTLTLFKSVKIFLGVELTLNPGVHLIIIGEDSDVPYFNALLDRVGYSIVSRGTDDILSSCDIRTVLDFKDIKDKIVIAPHIDSSKGIYKHLEGEYRAYIMSCENLNAVSCNNDKTAQILESDFFSQPQYKRKIPLNFIKASDAHQATEVGSKVSYIQMPKCNFSCLKESIKNPGTSISDFPNPEIRDFVDKVLEDKNAVICLPDRDSVSKALCACLNNEYGYVILGVSWPENELVGISESGEEFDSLLNDARQALHSSSHCVISSIEPHELDSKKYIYIITVKSMSSSIWSIRLSNTAFMINDSHGIKEATISDVEERAHENLLLELRKIEKQQETQINKIQSSLDLLRRSVTRGEICYKMKQFGMPLRTIAKIKLIRNGQTSGPAFYNDYFNSGNGKSSGNAFVACNENPRLKEAYLRCSCPCMGEIPDEELIKANSMVFNGSAIIITEKGAVYYVEKESWYLSADEACYVLTDLNEDFISYKALVGWLKSSVFLFYLLQESNSANLFEPENIYGFALVPALKLKEYNTLDKVEEKIEYIIQSEKEFLVSSISIDLTNDDAENQFTDLVVQHNKKVNDFALDIDNAFFEYFDISQPNRDCIYDALSAMGVYNLKC